MDRGRLLLYVYVTVPNHNHRSVMFKQRSCFINEHVHPASHQRSDTRIPPAYTSAAVSRNLAPGLLDFNNKRPPHAKTSLSSESITSM